MYSYFAIKINMAYNENTKKLLKKLGLEFGDLNSRDPQVLKIRNIYAKFLNLNRERSVEELNKELTEMLIMVEQAKQQAYTFLNNNGLRATNDLSFEWNEHFMCLEIKLKIDGDPISTQAKHYLSYEGREIQIRIMSSSSNNNFNPDDMTKMFEAKKQAALALNPLINTEFDDLESELQDLTMKFSTTKLARILEELTYVNQKLLCRLAVELIRKDRENDTYSPTVAEISMKISFIEKQETSNISRTRRAIKMVAYPQATNDSAHSQWMLTTNVPKSDISSDERALHVRRVPNAWDVTQNVCKFTNSSLVSVHKHIEVYRSASVAQLHEGVISRGIGSDEYKNLRNLIVETARDQIIERLNSGQEIDWQQIFSIKTLYLTLLTPLKDKESSSRMLLIDKLPTKIKDTLLKGNEDEQLHSLRTALLHISGKKLELSELDIQFILDHVPENATPDIKAKLQDIKIQHEYFYSNFTVNTFKKFDLGMFMDCTKNNELHNTKGVEYLDGHLIKFLNGQGFDLANIIYKPGYNSETAIKKEWPDIKVALEKELSKLSPFSNIYRALNLYMQLGDYFDSQQDRKLKIKSLVSTPLAKSGNSLLVESYFAAAIEVQLAAMMGFDIRTTCKSGKDRTGLFLAILEASAGPPEKFRINLCRALKYSDIKELIEQNRAGCRGVQVDADVMDGLRTYAGRPLEGNPKEFSELLTLWESRAVGSIPKKVYNKSQPVINEYVKANPPTTDSSSAPIQTTSRPAPLVPKRPAGLKFSTNTSAPDNMPKVPPKIPKRPPAAQLPAEPIINTKAAVARPLPPPPPPRKAKNLKPTAVVTKAAPALIDPDKLSFQEKLEFFKNKADKGNKGDPKKHG